MSDDDEFEAAFKQLSAAVDVFAGPLEKSPLALSAVHVERENGADYVLLSSEVFKLLEAKAAAWDEAHGDADAEAADEADLLGMLSERKH
ncbi:hypothetical protein SAMN05444007_103364 [Cribrihabitans marinus]|uniref:Uncharacterized protein n=1 Tax=Cribrihabitans marinus TaxID=1227549 RepID=A0A1H6WGJ4_9RHOB|nr:hypothetical protein [Cribrihabitans marinus]GGH24660.1 hypothetical protein GCM10010973_11310 [Cribrihabitans marinus]SEJ11920.1 hypothetical protein SAMN05444007_103364 [Cribrihabitans marinus]